MGSAANDAELVRAAQTGDRQAFSVLFERWFDRSYDVAWRIVRNRDTAAEVAQDTFLAAWTKLDTLRDPDAFGGWVLRSARNKALNRLEREGRSMVFDTDDTVGMIDLQRSAVDVADDIVRSEQADLVWAAAAALGERDASILDLHLRHDLGPAEIAEALDIAPNAAHQTLFRLRKRLEGAIRSYVLWSDGEPDCGDLAEALTDRSITAFGPAAVKAISAHVATCDACDQRHAAILSPASMFAAVPLLVVGPGIRRAAAAELAAQGVPIDPTMVSGEASTGLWQVNVDPNPARSRRHLVVAGGLAAVLVLVAATVVGAGLLSGDDPVEVEIVAAPVATDSLPRSLGSLPAPTTTELADLTEAEPTDADAPPADTEPPLVDPTTSTTVPPRTTVPPPATPPPTTAPPRDTTPSTTGTTAPSDPPRFTVLTLTPTGHGACGNVTGPTYLLEWATVDADHVVAGGPGVARGQRSPSGSLNVCSPAGVPGTWTFTAEGPGGSTFASITSS
jgi:RNA polymerase sigma factor (sigma-70 family)